MGLVLLTSVVSAAVPFAGYDRGGGKNDVWQSIDPDIQTILDPPHLANDIPIIIDPYDVQTRCDSVRSNPSALKTTALMLYFPGMDESVRTKTVKTGETFSIGGYLTDCDALCTGMPNKEIKLYLNGNLFRTTTTLDGIFKGIYSWSFVTSTPNTYIFKTKFEGDATYAPSESEILTVIAIADPTNQPPVAEAGPDQQVLSGKVVSLDGSASHDPESNPITYQWSIIKKPPASSAQISDPALIKPTFIPDIAGNYTCQLIVTDSLGAKSLSDNLTVHALIDPNFTANITSGYSPLTVQFNDTSSGEPTSWLWEFGDETTSTRQDPVHSYKKSGNFTVNLTVSNGAEKNTTRKIKFIRVKPKPVLLVWGWHGEKENWDVVKSEMILKGYTVEVFDYDDSQTASIAALNLKSKIIEMKKKNNVSKIDIIAHSFGGLVSRTYIEKQGGQNNIDHLIMIMTPNHGTGLADYLTGMKKDVNRDIVDEIFNSIGVFRADSDWGSSLDLRTQQYNTFLTQLNVGFSATGKKYLVIAGYDHYPDDNFLGINVGKPSSNRKFLPGQDDGVVTVSSARLPGVPLSCVALDHSDINPNREIKYTTIQRGEKLVRLFDVIVDTIIPFLEDNPLSYGSCPTGPDSYDDAGLVGLTSKVFIGIRPGETRSGNLKSNDGRFEIRISIPLPEPSGQRTISGENLGMNVSQFSFSLLTPSLNVITPVNVANYPNIRYINNSSYKGYSIKKSEPGIWGYYTKAVPISEGNANVTVTGIYNVTQYNKPVAYFTANKLTGNKPLTVKFSDQSTGMPTKWLWNFGNGDISTLRNPSYTFTSAGTYKVQLNVTNSFGSNASVKGVSIIVKI